jgi:hypothetical protein
VTKPNRTPESQDETAEGPVALQRGIIYTDAEQTRNEGPAKPEVLSLSKEHKIKRK